MPRRKVSKQLTAQRARAAAKRAALLERAERRQNPDAVLSVPEWAALNGISEPTAARMLKSGRGPRVTEVGKHRIGITVAANRAWQESRAR
jgi:predicted DNA-binding transcriptional regulator AlpA